MENILCVLRGLLSDDKIPNDFIFEMFGEEVITNIEKAHRSRCPRPCRNACFEVAAACLI